AAAADPVDRAGIGVDHDGACRTCGRKCGRRYRRKQRKTELTRKARARHRWSPPLSDGGRRLARAELLRAYCFTGRGPGIHARFMPKTRIPALSMCYINSYIAAEYWNVKISDSFPVNGGKRCKNIRHRADIEKARHTKKSPPA